MLLFRKTCTAEISAWGKVSMDEGLPKFPYIILKPVSNKKLFHQFFQNDQYTGLTIMYLSGLRKASVGIFLDKMKMAIVIDAQEHLSIVVGMMLRKQIMIADPTEKNKITLDITSAVEIFEPAFHNKLLEDYLVDHAKTRNVRIADMEAYKFAVLEKLQAYWNE